MKLQDICSTAEYADTGGLRSNF